MSHRRCIAVYIMANGRNGAIYIGVTSDLETRVHQHKTGAYSGHSKTKGCTRLVWFETYALMTDAIRREKRLKHWLRDWKLKLIEDANPDWKDLAADWWG